MGTYYWPEADNQLRSKREPKADVCEMGAGRNERGRSPLWNSGSFAQAGPFANPEPQIRWHRDRNSVYRCGENSCEV